MRRLFVRIFLGFVLVISLIMALQIVVFVGNGFFQARRWQEGIFEEYVEAFSSELDEYASYGIFSTERLEVPLLGAADDRVSALLLRDAGGTLKMAYGKPGRQEERLKGLAGADIQQEEVKAPVATIAINQTLEGSVLSHQCEVTKSPRKLRTLQLPSPLQRKDIAGTIQVVVNGVLVGSVDILTFSPMGYRPIVSLLKGILGPMAWSMAIAAILALLLAWGISKRIQKYTMSVRKALEELSHGKHGIVLPKTTVIENLAIGESIRELDRKLEGNDISRREWLNSISHDLATPVTSMKLMTDGLVDGIFPLTQENLEHLQKETDDLAKRINRIVYYAKLLSPSAHINQCPFPINDLVGMVTQSLSKQDQERVVFSKKEEMMEGDIELLARALVELIDNAAHASDGEIDVSISHGSCTVMNEGSLPPGIDFFEPWTKGDKSRSGGGNGLGLPIVGQIMHLHSGKATLLQSGERVIATLSWSNA